MVFRSGSEPGFAGNHGQAMDDKDPTKGAEHDAHMTAADGAPPASGEPSRRRLLLGGSAVAACAIVSVRPALAQTAASVLHCQIPVPDPARSGSMVAADGSVVPAGTQGAFPGAGRPFTGEQVKQALRGGRSLPGTGYEQNRAYINYIRRLQRGTSGFTCYASLQMPR